MTEKDKLIQDLRAELKDAELKLKVAEDYIKLLEGMIKSNNEARDISDFEG